MHRYLGYFVFGMVIIYSLAGITLIFRDTDFMKQEKEVTKVLPVGTNPEFLGSILGIRGFNILETNGNTVKFQGGTYNTESGEAVYAVRELRFPANKLTNLHKTPSKNVLHWFTLLFGVLLLFLAVSSLWMFKMNTKIFKNGMITMVTGILFAIALLIFA